MKKLIGKKSFILVLLIILAAFQLSVYAAWYDPAPVIAPTASGTGDGKIVGFDNTHAETAGNADWVINGAFSDFGNALANKGYQAEEFRDGPITFDKISKYDVFVIPEPNAPFSATEQTALLQYVSSGKGLFLIADHYNADRNYNTWDATEVFNGYKRGYYSPDQDWLATNFGVRFRFNALDANPISDILTPDRTFGITEGVAQTGIWAGATLAILDPNIAKGIVYINEGLATPWRYAVDEGVYSSTKGGIEEGPFVVIGKPNLGKIAFIGDSSPIEDSTPKYLREDNGAVKTTYNGFNDLNNGRLAVQIIDWLAQSESYTGFSSDLSLPTPGVRDPATQIEPVPEPWTNPPAGYIWDDPTTFAPGSYGSPDPVSSTTNSVIISEVYYDTLGDDNIEEFIELYNPTANVIDISGFTLTDNYATYTVPSGTTIGANSYLIVARDSAGFNNLFGFSPDVSGMSISLGNSGDQVILKDSAGNQIDFVAYENYVTGWSITASTGDSIYRSSVTTDTDSVNDWAIGAPSPTSNSSSPSINHIIVSEVYYDTIGDDTVEEFIELYNPTNSTIDLSGYTLTDNYDVYTLPAGTFIGGNSYLVIARNSTGFNALFGFNPDISGMTIALGNSGDQVILKDSTGSQIDFVAYENYVTGWSITASTGNTIYRSSVAIDTDSVNDWVTGLPNPKQ